MDLLKVHFRCYVVDEAYRESYASLRMLKNLRCIVESLAEDLNKKVAQVEEAVLPVSRYRGIKSLPSEVIVNIMTLVGGRFRTDTEKLDELMMTFLEVEPFSSHIPKALVFLQVWGRKNTWPGTFPPSYRMDQTKMLYLSGALKFTLHDFINAMTK